MSEILECFHSFIPLLAVCAVSGWESVTRAVHLHMKSVPVPFPAAVFAADLHLSSFLSLAISFYSPLA